MGSRHDDTITTFVDYDEVDIVLKDVENSWRLDELWSDNDWDLIYDDVRYWNGDKLIYKK